MLSKFFIDRPRFAMVIACILTIAGAIAAMNLPIKLYPDVAPPQVMVMASYPGADAQTVANTVGIPLEEAINGVDDMIYMSSSSSNSGSYSLTITFQTGTDSDMALVKVQNRIQQASPLLPSEVTSRGVTSFVSFSDTLGFIAFRSPNGTRDDLFLTDYASGNVANALKRVPGVGDVNVMGAKYSIRIWLEPDRLASLGLSTTDIASAISSQNRQASIGSVGSRPNSEGIPLTYSLTTEGRLKEVSQFENVVLRSSPTGGTVLLKDVARIELGSESYAYNSMFQNKPAGMIMVSQAEGSSALEVMNGVKSSLKEMEKTLPSDTEFVIGYDTTNYVNANIREIMITLMLTFTLVIIVCYLFLQDWRVTLVPVAAIPISLLATFIGLIVMGYSINIFTLFGLVLVIGTVVDNAIIVVERVMFIMDRDDVGPIEATEQAMKDVTGPMVATTLVFLAIFVPVAFMGGITGEIYRQFAVTISFAVTFSLVVALTLSPAMCAYMLSKIKVKTKGPLAWFNNLMNKATNGFVSGSMWIARRTIVTLLLLVGISLSCFAIMKTTPTSFVPDEDQGIVFAVVQLPEGASYERTQAVLDKLVPQLDNIPGVFNVMGVNGYSIMGDAGENVASVIMPLDDWSQRETKELSLNSIVAQVRTIAAQTPEAQINVFTPSSIPGLGVAGGLDLRLQSTQENDPVKLAQVMNDFILKINMSPEFSYAFSSYTSDTPHMNLDIDRQKAEKMGLSIGNIYGTLQTYFGTTYVNDINLGTQVNKVILQSDGEYRTSPDDVSRVFVTNSFGKQVPASTFMTMERTLAPRTISRFNLFPSAAINVFMNPEYSTGQGMERIAQLAQELPEGYSYAWSGQSYQEQQTGNQILLVLFIALLFGYLFLVAQYESWTVPMGVILSLPTAVLGALVGVLIMKISLSIYTQLGILLLIGLAAKNAILIVEFAQELHERQGLPIFDAAAQAARERFRSVMMTAFTCVGGVLPMLFASGAGAASRVHVGTTMFFGMSVASTFGIFLVPGLYSVLQIWRERIKGYLGRLFGRTTTDNDASSVQEG